MVADQDIQAIINQGEPGINALLDAYEIASGAYLQAAVAPVQVISGTTSSLTR